MNSALHHVGLTVASIDRSIRFYSDVLGCTLVERTAHEGAEMAILTGLDGARLITADLRLPNGDLLELVEYTNPPGRRVSQESCDPGHTHVAFYVADAEAAYEQIVRLGGAPRSRPVQLTAPGSSWDGARVFYALDPDGRTIELVQPLGWNS